MFNKNSPKQQDENISKSLNICCNYDYLELLFGASLPLDQVCYAFAYGSGAIQQKGENLTEKMVDFILVCNNSMLFHQKNQLWNPAHYSLPWRLFKTERLLNNLYWFQKDGFLFPKGAKLFYNTMISSKGRFIKYGVIDTEDFEADLLDWPKLYIAGRLHKPVLNVLVWPNDQNLGQEPKRPIWQAINDNRWMAVQAALLMLPVKFNIKEFLHKIVSLSYKGDVRMGWAEDEKKIEKLVEGAKEQLRTLYIPLLKNDKQVELKTNEEVEQDISTPTMFHRLQMLPYYVQRGLCNSYYPSRRFRRYNTNLDIEELIYHVSHRYDVPERLDIVLQKIVGQSSRHQSFKNALTAGISRSFKYIWPKLTKGILRK